MPSAKIKNYKQMNNSKLIIQNLNYKLLNYKADEKFVIRN